MDKLYEDLNDYFDDELLIQKSENKLKLSLVEEIGDEEEKKSEFFEYSIQLYQNKVMEVKGWSGSGRPRTSSGH